MKPYFALGASILVMGMLYLAASSIIGGRWMSHSFERVRIMEREEALNGAQTLIVQLSTKIEVAMTVAKDQILHPDTQYVCAELYGDPETSSVQATFADISNCPLPVARTLPLSGTIRQHTSSGTRTIRSMSIGGKSGTPAGQFSKSNLGFSGTR